MTCVEAELTLSGAPRGFTVLRYVLCVGACDRAVKSGFGTGFTVRGLLTAAFPMLVDWAGVF